MNTLKSATAALADAKAHRAKAEALLKAERATDRDYIGLCADALDQLDWALISKPSPANKGERHQRIEDARGNLDGYGAEVESIQMSLEKLTARFIEAEEAVQQAIDAVISITVFDTAASRINAHLDAAAKEAEQILAMRNDIYFSRKDRRIAHPGVDAAVARARPIMRDEMHVPINERKFGPTPSDYLPKLRAQLNGYTPEQSQAAA